MRGFFRDLTPAVVFTFLLPVCAVAQGRVPYPDVWVEHMFQEHMAFMLADNCGDLEKHHPGIDRHRSSAYAAMSDRGHHARDLQNKFSPIAPERYQPLQEEFLRKYGLSAASPITRFCDAGHSEITQRTPIGRMLKVPDNASS